MVTLQELNADPDFQKLDYEQQIEVRRDVFSHHLTQDPDFQKLNQTERAKVLEGLIFAPPALRDPQTAEQVQRIDQGIKAGDKEAIDFAKREVYLATLGKASLIANVVDRGLISPFLESMEKSTGVSEWDHADILQDPERKKIINYFDLRLSQDQGQAKKVSTMKAVIGTGALLAETAGLMMVGAGTTFAPKALGKLFTAPTASILNNADKVAKLSGFAKGSLKVGQSVLHAGATTTLGVARDVTNDIINEAWERSPEFRQTAQKNLRWMGGYFLGDVAFNMVADFLAPMGLSAIKTFRGVEDAFTEPVKESMVKVLSHETLDPKDWAQLTKAQRESVKRVQAAMSTMSRVEDLDPEKALGLVAASRGWSLRRADGGFEMSSPNRAKIKLKTPEEVNQFLLKESYEALGAQSAKAAGAVAGGVDRWSGRQIVRATLTELPEDSKHILITAAAPTGGRYTRGQIEAFGKMYLKATGGSEALQRSVNVSADGGVYRLRVGGKNIVEVPKGALSPEQEAKIVDDLFENIGQFRGKKVPSAVDFSSELKELYPQGRFYTPGFIDSIVQEKLGGRLVRSSSGWEIQTPEGVQRFASLKEAGDEVTRQTYEVADFSAWMKERFGMQVRVNEGSGEIVVRKRGAIVDQGKELSELIARNPSWAPKISGDYGPRFTVIGDEVGVEFYRKVATGSRDDLMKFLDNFASDTRKVDLGRGMKGVKYSVNEVSRQIELEIPQVGYRQRFSSLAEAKEFAAGWEELDNLRYLAMRKGHRLEFVGGQWVSYSEGGVRHTTKTLPEMEEYLKNKAPIPEWAPELSGLDQGTFADVEVPAGEGFASTITGFEAVKNPDYSLRTLLKTWTSPVSTELEAMVKEGGNPEVLKAFREIQTTRDFLAGEAHEFYKLVDQAFTYNGKKLTKQQVYRVKAVMEAKGDPYILKRLRDEVGVGDAEIAVAERVKELFGSSYLKGLSGRFGMSFDEFQFDYLPRINKARAGQRIKTRDTGKFFKTTLDENTRPKMDAFFKHGRIDEVEQLATSMDLRQTLTGYFNVGMREQYLGPLIERYKDTIFKQTDPRLRGRFLTYLQQIGGIPQGWSEETMQQLTSRIFRNVGIDEPMTKDLTKLVMGWGYTSALALRPALVIRNMNQIWTTLAPWMGNDRVSAAVKKIARDDGTLIQNLRRKNVVRSHLPLFGAENIDRASTTGKFVNKALRWYQNSDDFTRAVAYTAGFDRFMEGVDRLNRGVLKNADDFAKYTGMSALAPDVRKEIFTYLDQAQVARRAGSEAQARFRAEVGADAFAKRVTRQTMFEYEKGMGSMAFRGTMGKIFGMFGTYPLYYVDGLARQLRYASTAEKITYGARWLANHAALYGAFSSVGIRMEAFKPWNPMIFTGGPGYEMINTVLAAAGGDQNAARSLFRLDEEGRPSGELIQWALPFGFMLQDVTEGFEYAKQGDPYRAFLSMVGFSLFED